MKVSDILEDAATRLWDGVGVYNHSDPFRKGEGHVYSCFAIESALEAIGIFVDCCSHSQKHEALELYREFGVFSAGQMEIHEAFDDPYSVCPGNLMSEEESQSLRFMSLMSAAEYARSIGK